MMAVSKTKQSEIYRQTTSMLLDIIWPWQSKDKRKAEKDESIHKAIPESQIKLEGQEEGKQRTK